MMRTVRKGNGMKLNGMLWTVIGLMICAPVMLRAGTVVSVKSVAATEALFEIEQGAATDATAPTQPGKVYTASGEGATVVVGDKAMISASSGARLRVSGDGQSTEQPIELLEGGFQLHVGSKPSIFSLGDARLTVTEAKVAAIKVGDQWVVSVQSFFTAGTASITVELPPPPPPKVQPEEESDGKGDRRSRKKSRRKKKDEEQKIEPAPFVAPPKPIVHTQPLKKGEMVLLATKVKPAKAADSDQLAIVDLTARLTEAPVSGPVLSLKNVEDPIDLTAQGVDRDAAFEDIEIEEIEVEAGCVEICID